MYASGVERRAVIWTSDRRKGTRPWEKLADGHTAFTPTSENVSGRSGWYPGEAALVTIRKEAG